MENKIYFINFIIILLVIYLPISEQFEKKNSKLKEQNNKKENKISNKRKTDSSNDYQPIRILFESTFIRNVGSNYPVEYYIDSFERVKNIIPKLIEVIPMNEPIKIPFSSHPDLGNNTINDNLQQGINNYDLIILPTVNLNSDNAEWTTSVLVRDNTTGRPIVGTFEICFKQKRPSNYEYYLDYLMIHHVFHILGFSYSSFEYFKNGKQNVYKNGPDIYEGLTRNYIIIPEVLDFAKKYFGCDDEAIINNGIPLENQEENNGIAHWESRVLLGEIMSSHSYIEDLVISEFTLYLLKASGWYNINYCTGGLMRFGKHKGCDFLTDKCNKKYKNEFYDLNREEPDYPTCSPGRLGRGKIIFKNIAKQPFLHYDKNYGSNAILADYCLISETDSEDIIDNFLSGSCKRGNSDYCHNFFYEGNIKRDYLSSYLNETFSEKSFCTLVSIDHAGKEISRNYPHPYCYEMICSDYALTIKIGKQYLVCPRSGGKVEINGDYEGYVYCPDYNLICTGTVMCNDIFDCIKNRSITNESSFSYDYEIKTSQQHSEFDSDETLYGFEMDQINGKCPVYCSQCFEDKKCIKCTKGYNFVGYNINDKNPSCKNVDVSIGYFEDNYVYYPCLENCAKCSNETVCERCKKEYYFIGNDRTHCQTGYDLEKYYTTDNKVSYFPCNTNFRYCDECKNMPNSCYKCIQGYYFLRTKTQCIKGEIQENYFTEDGGILYKLCDEEMPNCNRCNASNNCLRCMKGFYFIKEDRQNCVNDKDLSEYYSTDKNISYFPCDTNINNCLKCSGAYSCTKCKEGFILIRKDKKECFSNGKDKTYEEDGYYYPCSDSIENCDLCHNKSSCYQCKEGYKLAKYKDGTEICINLIDKKYFRNPDGYYELCSEAIDNCEQCDNKDSCLKCKDGYYFLKIDFIHCINNLDLRKYYSKDGKSYFPCNEIMQQCNYCSEENICDECEEGFYLLKENKSDCRHLDIDKYYKNGTSYYPCNEAIKDCNKCYDSQSCYECENGGKLVLTEQNKCYEGNYFEENKEFIKINDTFYEKCSNIMPHCQECDNNTFCTYCQENYYFVNNNYKECIHKDNIVPEDEYYKFDTLNYYSCFKGIPNCKKCTNGETCTLCNKDYALLEENYGFCHLKSEFEKGYFHNEDETIFYSCLDNCDSCTNKTECIKCKDNFISFDDNKRCDSCLLNVNEINDDLSFELLKNYTNDYINENNDKYTIVDFYINKELNYSITLFREWLCTSKLLQNDYFQLNTEIINNKLRENIKNSKDYVFSYINYKYNSYIEIYNLENNEQININSNCTMCYEGNNLKITNNFTNELNINLGEAVINNILENNINVFDKDEPIFNDICKNFAIETIDFPIKERKELFYLGNINTEIICNDINCQIESIFMNNFTGICNCKIQTDFQNLFLNNKKKDNKELENFIKSKSSINSFLNFKCAKEAFSSNLKNNVNLYISCGFLVIQIALFVVYLTLNKIKLKKKKVKKSSKKDKKKLKSNPPKVEKFNVTDDLENQNEFEPSLINGKGDFEKDNQEKDIQIIYDDGDENDESCFGDPDPEKIIQGKDIDSVREKEIEDEIINSGGVLNEDILATKINLFKERRLKTKNEKKIEYSESSQEEEDDDSDDDNGEKRKKKTKLNFVEEDSFSGDEGGNFGNGLKIINKNRKKRNKNRDSYNSEKSSVTSKESLVPSEINDIQNDIIQKTEYTTFKEAVKKPDVSFLEYYWKLIQLKQPIINLFSPIKCLKLEESHIPTLVKLMRIIFILSLNMFFNLIHLEQKYFRKKYKHFDEKYNIRHALLTKKISLGERFSYGLSHAVLSGFISFLVCLIIQSVLNFFIFNIKKKLEQIGKISDKKENMEEILQLLRKTRNIYIIFFSIGFAVMIIIFYFAITFAEVYIGGVLDFVAGVFWTFIFLQIIPFIYCLIFAYCKYKGIKDNKEILFNIGLSIYF